MSLVGYSPWGHRESDMTEQLTFHFQPVSELYDLGQVAALLRQFSHLVNQGDNSRFTLKIKWDDA